MGVSNLAHGAGAGGDVLGGDGKDANEEDMDSGNRGVPEGPADTVPSCDVAALEEDDIPGPSGNDGVGS